MRISYFAILAIASFFVFAPSSNLRAQDESDKPAAEKTDVDPFDIPDGKDVDFYAERSQELDEAMAKEYGGRSLNNEEFKAVFTKLRDAKKVIYTNTRKGTDEKSKDVADRALKAYLNALAQLEDVDAISEVLADEIELGVDPRRVDRVRIVKRCLEIDIAGNKKDSETLKRIVDEICEDALSAPAQAILAFDLTSQIAGFDEAIGKEARKKLIETLRKSDDPIAKRVVSMILGKERFDNLVGNEMLVEGVWLDKTEVKWEEFKGKVVLVDFWATWCGPCLGEIPNVEKLYEKYHEAGFEVVGYSVDNDLERLEKFEEERKLPWKTASSKLSVEAGKQDLSEYYGVDAIPTMILVGRDGKAIDTRARGERLAELLKEQFPDVE